MVYLTNPDDSNMEFHGSRTAHQTYRMINGVLLQRDFHHPKQLRVVMAVSLTKLVIWSAHDDCERLEKNKTLSFIKENFTWKKIDKDVSDYTRNCLTCMKTKMDSHPPMHQMKTIPASRPRALLFIDFVGKLPTAAGGFSYLCMCLDVYTRFIVAYPIRNATTNAVIKCLETYIMHLDLPTAIISRMSSWHLK